MNETETFADESRLANSVDVAIDDVRNLDLPHDVKDITINNIELGNFIVHTFGTCLGNTGQMTTNVYESGEKAYQVAR